MHTIATIEPKAPDTTPAPPPCAAVRRDVAGLALHLARTRVDDLTVAYARRAGLDTNARRMIEVLACFGPVLTAIESLVPGAIGEEHEPFVSCRCGRTHTRDGWGELPYVGPLDDGREVLEMRRCVCGLTIGVAVGPSPTSRQAARSSATIEVDTTNAAVGPVVRVWGDADREQIDAELPDGWAVDWETTPAPLSSTRDGERGFAHPLRRAVQSPTPSAERR
jgi:hypothetical protein